MGEAGSAIGSAVAPAVTILGVVGIAFLYLKSKGVTVESVKEVIEENAESARESADKATDKANEIIDKIQEPFIDIPVIGPYVNLPQDAVNNVRDWLIGAGLQANNMKPDIALELSRVYVWKDEIGNLIDKAGNIIVPAGHTDPDPWHVLQVFRDRIEEAARASELFTRTAQEAKGRERIADFIAGGIPLFDPEGKFEAGFQSALDIGPQAAKDYITGFIDLSRTAFENANLPDPTATLTDIGTLMHNFQSFIDTQGKTAQEAFNATLHAFQHKLDESLKEQFRINVEGLF